jgi:hypothetical protein
MGNRARHNLEDARKEGKEVDEHVAKTVRSAGKSEP